MKNGHEQVKVSGKRRHRIFFLIMTLMVCVTCVVVSRIALYIWTTSRMVDKPVESPAKFRHKLHFYTYPPSKSFKFKNENGTDISIKTDEYGFRNPQGQLKKSDVILLGDSYLTAINTKHSATIPAILSSHGIPSYNAGMDGFSTVDEFGAIRDLVVNQKARPKAVVLCFYLGNDFHDNYCHSNTACDDLSEALRGAKSFDNVMPSFPLSEMESYRKKPSHQMMLGVFRTVDVIRDTSNFLNQHSIKLFIAGIPSKAQTAESFYEISGFFNDKRSMTYSMKVISDTYSFDQPNSTLWYIAKKENAEYISLLDNFRAGGGSGLYYKIDHHWNDRGQNIAARTIEAQLRASMPETWK